ncbi:MAG TPA: HipA family kinase [bacterium]
MIKVAKIYQEIRTGSSLPLVVGGNDGEKYVVKLRGSGDGVLANVVEWLAIRLGQLLGIPVVEPELLAINARLSGEAGDPEIKELLQRSVGINFGTRFKEDARPYDQQKNIPVDDSLQTAIFLYDLFLLNIDRTPRNPNMIFSDNRLWCLDYSSALTIRCAIDQQGYKELPLLRQIKRHPFYSPKIKAHDFIHELRNVDDDRLIKIVDELPDEWIGRLAPGKVLSRTRRIITDGLIAKGAGDSF